MSERAAPSRPRAVHVPHRPGARSTPDVLTGAAINDALTTAEAARLVGCSTGNMARLCRIGRIPARKVGNDWRIDPRDLERSTLPCLGRPRVANPRYNAQARHERYLRQRAGLLS